MDIKVTEFGKLPDGTVISSYHLSNDKGITVRIINYGGIITHLFTPDKNGKPGDIVLGFDKLEDYLGGHPYFGAIIGRYANRIGNAEFTLNGKKYKLAKNNGPNHLHGGLIGFDKKVWLAVKSITNEFVALKLAIESPDMEESYPGNLMVEVEYVLNNQNELVINYTAQTDKETFINMTNHSYFNLSACEHNIYENILSIDADYLTEFNDNQIPTGKIIPVKNTPFDFRKPKAIGKDISKISLGYDHNFVLNGSAGHLRKISGVLDPATGRTLDVLTTQPGVQFYTANYTHGIKGKGGKVYNEHSAFCLETQHYPDSPNKPDFPSTLLKPGEKFMETTVYRFGVTR